MLNDFTLSADGLSPSWRLTDGVGNSISGYDWSTSGISGVGGGSLKYRVTYTSPPGIIQWGLEARDNIGGPVSSATVNVPDFSPLLQQVAAIGAELDAVKAKTDLINTVVSVVIGDALPNVTVEIC